LLPILPSEILTILIPERRSDGSLPVSRKSFCIHENGNLSAQGYDLRKAAFRFEPREVQGLSDVASLLTKISDFGNGFIVRGNPMNSEKPRLQARRFRCAPDQPATLRDVPKHLAVVDMDKVPNVLRIDPRTNPEGAAQFLLSLLPAAVASAQCIICWSSSMCVGQAPGTAPETLSVHIYLWLVAPVGYEALKDILKGVDVHARDKLACTGHQGSWTGKCPSPSNPFTSSLPVSGMVWLTHSQERTVKFY